MAKTIEQTVDEGIERIVAANPKCSVLVSYENASGRNVQHDGCLSIWESRNYDALGYRVENVEEPPFPGIQAVRLIVVY